jgi:hypothetical protein
MRKLANNAIMAGIYITGFAGSAVLNCMIFLLYAVLATDKYEKFRVLKQKRVESARHAAHARYERSDALRMRYACESEAPCIRDECLSFSYSNTEKEEKDASLAKFMGTFRLR